MLIRVSKLISAISPALFAYSVYAQGATVESLVRKIISGVLQPVITLLFALATVIFLWGIIQYVIAQAGDEKKLADAKRVMIWGIIGLTIMASAWGIVAVLCDFFGTCGIGGSGGTQPNFDFQMTR